VILTYLFRADTEKNFNGQVLANRVWVLKQKTILKNERRHLGAENVKKAKNRLVYFQMIKLGCKVVLINNFQRPSYSSKYLEGNHEKFSKSINIYAFYDFSALTPRYGAMSQALHFQNAAFICMCDAPLDILIDGLIGVKFI